MGITIVIDTCMQNGTLSYAVISGTLEAPLSHYAEIPANAMTFFTSAPIILFWILYHCSLRVWRFGQKKFSKQENIAVPAHLEDGHRLEMLRISDIKEVWGDQHNLRPLWC